MFGYLAAMFCLYLTNNALEMGQYFSSTQAGAEISFILSQIFIVLVMYFFILLLDVFYSNRSFSQRQTLITILTFLLIGGLITNPELEIIALNQGYLINFKNYTTVLFLETTFHFIATIILFTILLKSRKSAWSSRQKKLIVWLLLGSILGILLPSFPSIALDETLVNNAATYILIQILKSIPRSIGILIIGLAFLRVSRNPWLLQRQKVDFLVVYNHSGLRLFSKIFSKEIKTDDTLLLAGAFSAVTSLIKETTKSGGNVEAIMLQGKELKVINRDIFICALLVEYTTQASDWALKNFTLEFENKYRSNLLNFGGDISTFKPAEEIAMKYFS